jgi:Fe2+ transport system protein B
MRYIVNRFRNLGDDASKQSALADDHFCATWVMSTVDLDSRRNAFVSRRIKQWESGELYNQRKKQPCSDSDDDEKVNQSSSLSCSNEAVAVETKEQHEQQEVSETEIAGETLLWAQPPTHETTVHHPPHLTQTIKRRHLAESSTAHQRLVKKSRTMSTEYERVPAQEEESVSLDKIIKAINVDDATPEERENLAKIINALKQQQKLEESGQLPRTKKSDGVVIPDYIALPVLAACFVLLFALMMGKVWYQMNQVKKLQGNQ